MPKTKKNTKEEISRLEAKANEYLANWQRATADLENLKKRFQQEKENFQKYCLEDLILQILPVLDNFGRAVAHVPASEKESDWLKGIFYIQKQLTDILAINGVREIAIKAGDEFDPQIAEAVEQVESNQYRPHQIVNIEQAGYRLNGKIIRHAKAVVAK